MPDQFYFINAFAKAEFMGNPAVIVILESNRSDEWLQKTAAEFNQPITSFLIKEENDYQLRWFTPVKELTLCGHGTLGAAFVLWNDGFHSRQEPIYFQTKGGKLKAGLREGQVILTLDLKPVREVEVTPELKQVVDYPIHKAAWAGDRYIIEFEKEEMVYRARPIIETVEELKGAGLVITSKGKPPYDFISRYFAPSSALQKISSLALPIVL
ncbi:PhzF family phenazine biosynthesis isomerase [Halobacillus salinarum]|uniref:PhzF family phenazine biosynthesis isomerase n=1 Tax=Halobacillus salinarum TaxID=2932257 RepID=A0ABY4ELX8_9BACI|nr:PhzF family phenazine biosynthesis isomerase [Halobacillus salinarum]UOQ45133.1 PhzF family phenazine biosynthesis isomerase [Halobacillus salinarum]